METAAKRRGLAIREPANAVKEALTTGRATPSTVTSLLSLLSGGDCRKEAGKATAGTREEPPIPTRRDGARLKSSTRQSRKDSPLQIHEDSRKSLSPKERYALATEIVNVTLKALTVVSTSTAEHADKTCSTTGVHKAATPRWCDGSSTSPRALQPRSGNTTPTPTKEQTVHGKAARIHQERKDAPAVHITAAGECASISFSHLRNSNPDKFGIRPLPSGQLTRGMLLLSEACIGHGLHALAIRELRAVKKQLESDYPIEASQESKRNVVRYPKPHPVRETLITLLDIKIRADLLSEAWRMLVTYHILVLKTVVETGGPATIDACILHLDTDKIAPVNISTKEQSNQPNELIKASRHLGALSSTLLSFCPSVSTTADNVALDRTQYPGPLAVLKLQTHALAIRKRCSAQRSHQADFEKELVEPFIRCLKAAVRRIDGGENALEAYQIAKRSCDTLFHEYTSAGSFSIGECYNLLGAMAEKVRLTDGSRRWCDLMERSCNDLADNHARKLAVLVRKTRLWFATDNDCQGFRDVATGLGTIPSGQSSDFELLLTELSLLLPLFSDHSEDTQLAHPSTRAIQRMSAAFAQRFCMSYPGRGDKQARTIIYTVLRQTTKSHDATQWLTMESARLSVRSGALKSVVAVARCKSLESAWASSSDAAILGRILHLLVLKAPELGANAFEHTIFDVQTLSTIERGLLLEWQLQCALEYAGKSKYTTAMQRALPALAQRLANIYVVDQHPLKRAIVATRLLRFHGIQPDLLRSAAIESWVDLTFDTSNLHNDNGLAQYAKDIFASARMAQLIHLEIFSWEQIKPCLLTWEGLIIASHDKPLLEACVYDTTMLCQQLKSIVSFLGAVGRDYERLAVLHLLVKLSQLLDPGSSQHVAALAQTGEQWMAMGRSKEAAGTCSEALMMARQDACGMFARLMSQVTSAEHHISVYDFEKARAALDETRILRISLPPAKISKGQRTEYEVLHARVWVVQSKLNIADGVQREALVAAKHAVRLINGIWQRLERNEDTTRPTGPPAIDEIEDPTVTVVTDKVSKLHLTSDCKTAAPSSKGAAFWPVVPIACVALMHLSDMYAQHGVFMEANFYSERAVSTANAVQSSSWASRARSHRASLLTLAGRLEDAELCLAADDASDPRCSPMATVERYRAEAAIRAKDGENAAAVEMYEKAEVFLERLHSTPFVGGIEGNTQEDSQLVGSVDTICCGGTDSKKIKSKPQTTARRRTDRSERVTGRGVKNSACNANIAARNDQIRLKPANETQLRCSMLDDVRNDSFIRKTFILLSYGKGDDEVQRAVTAPTCSATMASRQRQLHCYHALVNAAAMLQTNVAFNALFESSLSYPSVSRSEDLFNPANVTSVNCSSQGPKSKSNKAPQNKVLERKDRREMASVHFTAALLEAYENLLKDQAVKASSCQLVDLHKEGSMLMKLTLLLASSGLPSPHQAIGSAQGGYAIDSPRIFAGLREQVACSINGEKSGDFGLLEWPVAGANEAANLVRASAFQREYVDILPESWTAVSLCLNEEQTELYAARYRSGRAPFLVRLPFSRHEEDGCEDGAFDFAAGKAELQEIIERSNQSCHLTDMSAKGAKSGWWQERESLDRRLHELLINIENIWLGGFKSVLSPRARQIVLLTTFRKAFEAILDRHLPSRIGPGERAQRLILDDNVLELFVNLSEDQDSNVDFEEPVADLLYFVVDMLQFNGEQNAYDEVDFDSMTIEVLEAIRSYHELLSEEAAGEEHLILVLDKRLQAFPWENLPCLADASVTRLGSMLSLRERILAMRADNPQNVGRFSTSRDGGMIILNPSSDLKNTQAMLEPALSELQSHGAGWTSIVDRIPSEDDLRTALSKSRMMLYFGHGAGSQYIRPRTVKKLERCSEVVWLMGCSSGAVTEYGELEPQAMPLSYLLAGSQAQTGTDTSNLEERSAGRCMAVLANLWDVTDKDIDRFSLAVGEEWGLWSRPAETQNPPAKTPSKRTRFAAYSTPQQASKPPKTPKGKKPPATAETPGRSRSRQPTRATERLQSLSESVAKSRDVCYLRYLNGAAPVVYGVPVYVGS